MKNHEISSTKKSVCNTQACVPVCLEDNTMYYGNDVKTWNNNKNITEDSRACQQKCKSTAKCKYWSFEKKGNGRCYLKTKKERCQI